jgi:hypothetical protein
MAATVNAISDFRDFVARRDDQSSISRLALIPFPTLALPKEAADCFNSASWRGHRLDGSQRRGVHNREASARTTATR